MIFNLETAKKTSEYLLQIKAIKINPTTPFTWASGWKSPIYCDNRKTLSYPTIRNYLRQQMVECINEKFKVPDMVAGVATGGIPLGTLVAHEMGLPFVYIRGESKGHGLNNKIEGVLEKGRSIIVIEDLISTGGSSLAAINAIKEAGANVVGMVANFTYNFEIAKKRFEEAKCEVFTLTDYITTLDIAVENSIILEQQLKALKDWRENPDTWGK